MERERKTAKHDEPHPTPQFEGWGVGVVVTSVGGNGGGERVNNKKRINNKSRVGGGDFCRR